MRRPAPLPRPRAARPALALAVASLALGACAPAPLDTAPSPAPSPAPAASAAARAPLVAWPGTYELVGSNFPDGTRAAGLEIARVDTTYRLTVHGPPGELVTFRIVADSVHVLWDLGPGDALMAVELRLAGDALTGRWEIDGAHGPITGRRVR